jgi:hypothetical protein
MFCPKCRTEYKEGITVCADCGTPLVEELPPEVQEPAELVTVLITGDLSTVALAKSILEDAQIPCVAKGEYPMEQLAVGPVEIQVDRRDREQARELLEGLAEGTAPSDMLEQIPPDEEEPPEK